MRRPTRRMSSRRRPRHCAKGSAPSSEHSTMTGSTRRWNEIVATHSSCGGVTHCTRVALAQFRGDLALIEMDAALVLDEKGYPARLSNMAGPRQRFVERRKFLEQHVVLVQGRNRLGPSRPAIDPECHDQFSSISSILNLITGSIHSTLSGS